MTYGYRSLSGLAIDAYIHNQTGGHFQFLTIQGLVVAWLTMIVSLVTDLVPSFSFPKRIKRALTMLSLPLSMVVASIYWTLLLLAPHLIMLSEPTVTFRTPLLIDLSIHAVPALSLLSDFILFEHKYSPSETCYVAPLVTVVAAVWYSWWTEYCARFNGTFPYPFLTNNPFEVRVQIYFGAASLALVSFWIINSLHRKPS